MGYGYEAVNRKYQIGELLRNLNGTYYMVLDKLSEKNLLLMNMNSKAIVIAIGTNTYERYPKDEAKTQENTQEGIEWDFGVYPDKRLSFLDFEVIRRNYGEAAECPSRIEDGQKIYEIEVRETLSRTVDIQAKTEEEAFELAQEMYDNEEIVLDADDFVEMNLMPANEKIMEKEKVR